MSLSPQIWNGLPLIHGNTPAVDPACCCHLGGVVCRWCINNIMAPAVVVTFQGLQNSDCDECVAMNGKSFECPSVSAGEYGCQYQLGIAKTPFEDCTYEYVRFQLHIERYPDPTDFGVNAQLSGYAGGDVVNFSESFSKPTNQYPIDCNVTWILPWFDQTLDTSCDGQGGTATVVPKWN